MPRDVKDAVSKCQKAVQQALQDRCSRMDIEMPVMDGLEATRLIVERLDREDCLHRPEIVFLTAHALDDFRSKGDEAGASYFLSKPFKLQDIQSLLERALPS